MIQFVSIMMVSQMKLMKVICTLKNNMIQEFGQNLELQYHLQHQIDESVANAQRQKGNQCEVGKMCYHLQ
jgi:hypothetical protein